MFHMADEQVRICAEVDFEGALKESLMAWHGLKHCTDGIGPQLK